VCTREKHLDLNIWHSHGIESFKSEISEALLKDSLYPISKSVKKYSWRLRGLFA